MIMSIRTVLAANSTATPLVGQQYEFLDIAAGVEFSIQTDATGVLATVYAGDTLLYQEGPVQLGTINVQPKYPDDFYLREAITGGRLSVLLRDTSGAQRIVQTVVMISPL